MTHWNWISLYLVAAFIAITGIGESRSLGADLKPPFPAIFNSEKSTNALSLPEAALRAMKMPPGFRATVFAAEPDVQQPIAMAFDTRGRLWVAENYTYADSKINFDSRLRDRIVIFEDRDGDGHFDKRTVFWDDAQKLTSIELGFGGVWALCAPHLLFIPDHNGDDVPDGPPEVMLDGWNDGAVRHNIVNGLRWGPDGWLYGRHGIMATSLVGAPGALSGSRQKLNCSIWRFQPTRKIFEVVTHGTTNPWGLDYDEYGEMFFSNTVIGHLWHVIPGAHYKRMYGEDFDAHTYDLIDQHADHYHWDTGKSWQDSREGQNQRGNLGGGHAHSGLMIYLGDNWPAQYRNTLFTVNMHGRRLNNDRIERSGSGYVGRHQPDLFQTEDPWYRAVELGYGPDGGVYQLDWSDVGECHENDGVHRTSGRIYKIVYGAPKTAPLSDVSRMSNDELITLLTHKNDWFVRQARRVFQERAAAGASLMGVRNELLDLFNRDSAIPHKLRALWALAAIGETSRAWLEQQLAHPDEHVRAWAVRLLTEQGLDEPLIRRFAQLTRGESGLPRLYLASALQRIPVNQRAELASALAARKEDQNDHNLPLLIWYGTTAMVAAKPEQAIDLLASAQLPLVRKFIARQITEQTKAPATDLLVKLAGTTSSPEIRRDILRGMSEALRGIQRTQPPAGWPGLVRTVDASEDAEAQKLARALSVVFGDGRALEELATVALDALLDPETQREAARNVIQSKPANLHSFLKQLLTNKSTAGLAAKSLAALDDPAAVSLAIAGYNQLSGAERGEVIGSLAARRSSAEALLSAVKQGQIARADITPFHARQMLILGDEKVTRKLTEVWGDVRQSPQEKQQLIAKYKALFTADVLQKADRPHGRAVFNQACSACHTLHGQGGKTGPDLTGGGRDNLDYLLENIVDPSGMVAVDFRMSVIHLKDGRTINGVIGTSTERTMNVQTMTEKITFERAEIIKTEASALSLMPDGLLEALSTDDARDLIAYLSL